MAAANGTLAAFDGRFKVSACSRSGGGPGLGGSASGSAHCQAIQDYQVVSATLPAGTPVTVSINWAVSGRATAAGNMTHYLSGAIGTLNGQVNITVGGVSIINVAGERRRQYNTFDGYYYFIYGTLNPEEDHREHMVTALVGQYIRIGMTATASGNTVAVAVTGDSAAGDSQMSMLWGITSTNPNASIVSLTYPGQPPPPAAQATPENSLAYLPDRPVDFPQCFTFLTQPINASACAAMNAGFSVSATGTGPFSYQWRRNNVPVDSGANPSAATATLSLTGVSAADAGSYTVVVTNPCGDRTSDAAVLQVLPVCPCSAADIATEGNPDLLAGPDGFVTGVDFDVFVIAYFKDLRRAGGTLVADLTEGTGTGPPDGFVTGTDFDFFVVVYFQGC